MLTSSNPECSGFFFPNSLGNEVASRLEFGAGALKSSAIKSETRLYSCGFVVTGCVVNTRAFSYLEWITINYNIDGTIQAVSGVPVVPDSNTKTWSGDYHMGDESVAGDTYRESWDGGFWGLSTCGGTPCWINTYNETCTATTSTFRRDEGEIEMSFNIIQHPCHIVVSGHVEGQNQSYNFSTNSYVTSATYTNCAVGTCLIFPAVSREKSTCPTPPPPAAPDLCENTISINISSTVSSSGVITYYTPEELSEYNSGIIEDNLNYFSNDSLKNMDSEYQYNLITGESVKITKSCGDSFQYSPTDYYRPFRQGLNFPPYPQGSYVGIPCGGHPSVVTKFTVIYGAPHPSGVGPPYYANGSITNNYKSCLAPFYCYYVADYTDGKSIGFGIPPEKILNGGNLSYCLVGEKLEIPWNRAYIFPRGDYFIRRFVKQRSTFADAPQPLFLDSGLMSESIVGHYTPPPRLPEHTDHVSGISGILDVYDLYSPWVWVP